MKKLCSAILCSVLILSMASPAYAVDIPLSPEEAGAYLHELGIYQGNDAGDLMLDKGLTRAELAIVLTRIHGKGDVAPEQYAWACYYTDVPAWAKGYVGYCTAMLLVKGYGDMRFGASDLVTPAAACTVVLRAYGHGDGEGSVWNYNTACSYAIDLGLISQSAAQANAITRGDMAVLIYQAMKKDAVQPVPLPEDGIVMDTDGNVTSKTITQAAWSREDFSLQANPAIFTGCYSRAWYNAIRQSIADREVILAVNNEDHFNPGYLYAHTLAPSQSEDSLSAVLGQISGLHSYSLGAEPYTQNQFEYPGYTIIKVYPKLQADEILAYIQPQLNDLQGRTDREKVIALNLYLCTLMDYASGRTAVLSEIFSPHTRPVLGRCSSYAGAFAFLCEAADIPCIIVSSVDHSWNEVFVDGQWLTVDVSSNDVLGGPGKDAYLLTDRAPGTDRAPDGTQFARELLIPGSTIR